MYTYKAIITNVVDGDTYDADIDLGFHIHIHERIRVLGLDTPECRGEEKELGRICKEYAEHMLLNQKILLRSEKEIKEPKQDSFGRWLCRVFLDSDKTSIAEIFTNLGCNKLKDNYSEEEVKKLTVYSYLWE